MSRASRTTGRGSLPRLVPLGILVAMLLIPNAPTAIVSNAFAGQDARSVTLGFGDRYGESLKQHLGCDVPADSGEEVLAPVDGTVSFVGWVPRDEGVRVRAVTVRDGSGALVSVSPLAEYSVALGDAVRIGSPLGTVAETGDPSTPDSHIHLSLRVDDRYLSPAHLVGWLFAPRAVPDSKETKQEQPASGPVKRVAKPAPTLSTPMQASPSTGGLRTVPKTAAAAVAERSPESVSQPADNVVQAHSYQVADTGGLDRPSSAWNVPQPAVGSRQSVEAGTSTAEAPSRYSDRALVAWAIFGVGTALGVGALVLWQSCQSTGLVGRRGRVFAVRGNR